MRRSLIEAALVVSLLASAPVGALYWWFPPWSHGGLTHQGSTADLRNGARQRAAAQAISMYYSILNQFSFRVWRCVHRQVFSRFSVGRMSHNLRLQWAYHAGT